MIKAICFDMDGVLVDACEWHRISLNKALKEICGYEISYEEHIQFFNGIPTIKKLNILLDRGLIKKNDIEKIEELKQFNTIDVINNHCIKREEKIELMKYLKNKKILNFCYTNSIRQTTEIMLSKTGILDYFDLLLTNKDVTKPKPDPEGYKYLLNKFMLKPEEMIIVEDSPKGFEAAYLSGCKVFRVLNQEQVDINLFRGFV